MGEVLRGRELPKVIAFTEAKMQEHKEREDSFWRFVRGKHKIIIRTYTHSFIQILYCG